MSATATLAVLAAVAEERARQAAERGANRGAAERPIERFELEVVARDLAELRAGLVQAAAVAVAWIEAIDRRGAR